MLFLIGLIFISKVSLTFLPGMPREIFPFIFQSGIHPYINIFLCVTVGSVFILKKLLNPEGFTSQSRIFRFLIVLASLHLLSTTLLQIIFQIGDESIGYQIIACLMSIFTMYLFGRVIPTNLDPKIFLQTIKKWSVVLCWLSLVALIFFSGTSFKGGRFIGVFKHIPHMVSVATFCCCFLMYDFFVLRQSKRQKLISLLSFFCGFFLLVLTGTRSALASVLMTAVLSVIIFPAKNPATKLLKTSIGLSCLLLGLFFGDDLTDYTINVVRGEQAVGLRAAQDGIASRLDEIERGYNTFQDNQWLGLGLLSKFGSTDEKTVGNYNANKDPHNLFISAGVVGGWGLVAITAFGFFALIWATMKSIVSKNSAIQILAIYMLTQIPIIFIYHIHLSMGGIADRIYWIIFGYLAIHKDEYKNDNSSTVKSMNE
jgi:hypothetical protein